MQERTTLIERFYAENLRDGEGGIRKEFVVRMEGDSGKDKYEGQLVKVAFSNLRVGQKARARDQAFCASGCVLRGVKE